MNEKNNLDGIKAFVLSFEGYGYSNELLLAMIAPIGFMTIAMLISVNFFIIVLSIIDIVLIACVVVLVMIKKNRWVFLWTGIMGLTISLSFCGMIVNSFYSNNNAFLFMIILMIVCHIVPFSTTIIIIKYRINKNYYNANARNVGDLTALPSVTVCIILAGIIGGRVLSITTNMGDIIIVLFMIPSSLWLCYKSTEHFIRHYYVCKYDLESALIFKEFRF